MHSKSDTEVSCWSKAKRICSRPVNRKIINVDVQLRALIGLKQRGSADHKSRKYRNLENQVISQSQVGINATEVKQNEPANYRERRIKSINLISPNYIQLNETNSSSHQTIDFIFSCRSTSCSSSRTLEKRLLQSPIIWVQVHKSQDWFANLKSTASVTHSFQSRKRPKHVSGTNIIVSIIYSTLKPAYQKQRFASVQTYSSSFKTLIQP